MLDPNASTIRHTNRRNDNKLKIEYIQKWMPWSHYNKPEQTVGEETVVCVLIQIRRKKYDNREKKMHRRKNMRIQIQSDVL